MILNNVFFLCSSFLFCLDPGFFTFGKSHDLESTKDQAALSESNYSLPSLSIVNFCKNHSECLWESLLCMSKD